MKKFIVVISYGYRLQNSDIKITNAANKAEARKKVVSYLKEQKAAYPSLYEETSFVIELLTPSKLAKIQAEYEKVNAEYEKILRIHHALSSVITAEKQIISYRTI